jgi:predicted RNA polymerase sigma factor
VRLMPDRPEVLGLLALMRLHLARADARFDGDGNLVLLQDQDRGRWDQERIASAMVVLQRAATLGRPGPYQLQAAIAACHTEARSWTETDWRQIITLYDALLELTGSPVVHLNRAIARRYLDGALLALAEVDRLGTKLESYYLFHATRAELLRDLGHDAEAGVALSRALGLTANPAERALLQRRMGGDRGDYRR